MTATASTSWRVTVVSGPKELEICQKPGGVRVIYRINAVKIALIMIFFPDIYLPASGRQSITGYLAERFETIFKDL